VAVERIQSELEQYRRLMEPPPPEEFEEGFSIRTILGALFVAFVMLPGAAYLGTCGWDWNWRCCPLGHRYLVR
jgi:hypothetical protein